MNSLFEDLCTGLQEAIDFKKGIGSAKKKTYVISPIKEFNPEQIRLVSPLDLTKFKASFSYF